MLYGFLQSFEGHDHDLEPLAAEITVSSSIRILFNTTFRLWDVHEISSRHPLLDEDIFQPDGYYYTVYLRVFPELRSICVLADNSKLSKLFLKSAYSNLEQPTILVHEFVESYLLKEGRGKLYTLHRIYAEYDAVGDAVESVSFWGQDIAISDIFKQNLKWFRVHNIETFDEGDGCYFGISQKGTVSLKKVTDDSLVQLEDHISLLYEKGYVVL